MGKVYVFDHPLIQHKVSLMRMKETSVKDFRQLYLILIYKFTLQYVSI